VKKLLCILAAAALLGACEQKTEVTAPAAPAQTPDPAKAQRLNRKTGPTKTDATTTETTTAPANTDATTTTETKTESTTTSTPNP
jgi:ABC-type uncharacterized transport system auxiliary subunit